MEEKLLEYRARRRKTDDPAEKSTENSAESKKLALETRRKRLLRFLGPEFFENMKNKEEILLMSNYGEDEVANKESQTQISIPEKATSETSEVETIPDEREESWRYAITKWTVYFIVWLTGYIFFLKLQFGAVYFVITALIGICLNTRTRARKQDEVSAYSVFNEGCQSIDGTLTAEQFENEIRFGPGNVRSPIGNL